MTALAFKSADEIFDHYKANRARIANATRIAAAKHYHENKGRKVYLEPIGPANRFRAPKYPHIYWPPIGPVYKKHEPIGRDIFDISTKPRGPSLKDIIAQVSSKYNVPICDLKSSRRASSVTIVRQIAMFRMKTETFNSLPAIGKFLGGRDHTTILHGVRKIQRMIDEGRSPL